MCQPFQILKQLGVIYEILYERYGMRDSTTSYCLITTIISNVVDAWICGYSNFAIWDVLEIIVYY